MSKEVYTTLTESTVNTAIARLYAMSANHKKNNIHNDTLSVKLKATKSSKILSDSRMQAGAVPLQRRLSVAGIAGLLSCRSKLPARTPVGLSSTLRRPLRRSLRQTRLASRARRLTS